ncbi:MAG: hypothetical protein HC831_15065 [Chloroflexia bacterium]|nr:hypothetical protein [Chloroflexia bacterium]
MKVVDILVVGLVGLDWDGIDKAIKVARKCIDNNKHKAILLFQSNTDKYLFPSLILEKIGQTQFDFQHWVKKYGKPIDSSEFKIKL